MAKRFKNVITPDGEEIMSVYDDTKENAQKTPEVDPNESEEMRNFRELKQKGADLYNNHKIIYIMFCTGWGFLICILLGQIIMQPVLRTAWADDFAVWFNTQIHSMNNSGASKGVLCNICALCLIGINLVIRFAKREIFGAAKAHAEMLIHQKNGC